MYKFSAVLNSVLPPATIYIRSGDKKKSLKLVYVVWCGVFLITCRFSSSFVVAQTWQKDKASRCQTQKIEALAVFTLETDYQSETRIPLDNSRQTDNAS